MYIGESYASFDDAGYANWDLYSLIKDITQPYAIFFMATDYSVIVQYRPNQSGSSDCCRLYACYANGNLIKNTNVVFRFLAIMR